MKDWDLWEVFCYKVLQLSFKFSKGKLSKSYSKYKLIIKHKELHTNIILEMSNYTYIGKFSENIPVLGQTSCGKTMSAQNLAKSNMFGKLEKVNWISKIELPKKKNRRTNHIAFSKKRKLNFIIFM